MMPKVTIILLNWNGLEDTLECLSSLSKIPYPDYDIIVVDNASTGNDVETILSEYGEIISRIIVNKTNLGFSGGNNVGIKAAIDSGADYVLLLNNDTVVEPDFLTKLIEQKDALENVGILTSMINYYDNKNKIWSAGGNISKIKASGFTFGHNNSMENFSFNTECTFASGCAMLISREIIEKIGLLDEEYFLYLEDTDYCQRVINAGYKIYYVGKSRIYHKVFSSTSRDSELLPLYYSFRNRLYFARKNLGWYFYFSVVYLVLVFLTKLLFVFKKKKHTAKVLLRAFMDFVVTKMGRTDIFDVR